MNQTPEISDIPVTFKGFHKNYDYPSPGALVKWLSRVKPMG